MTKLRLGAIGDAKPVKLTIELPAELHADLVRYAEVHARETGLARPLPPEKLIAPMIGRFMATDREFARQRRAS